MAEGTKWLDDARRLHRRFAGWLSNCLGGEHHHLWPIYLGENPEGPVVRMPRDEHKMFHNELRELYQKSRWYYCKLYHAEDLTTKQDWIREVWNTLDRLYYKHGYYEAWHSNFPEPPPVDRIFQCERYIGRRCGGRGRTICGR